MDEDEARKLVETYNKEGQEAYPPDQQWGRDRWGARDNRWGGGNKGNYLFFRLGVGFEFTRSIWYNTIGSFCFQAIGMVIVIITDRITEDTIVTTTEVSLYATQIHLVLTAKLCATNVN